MVGDPQEGTGQILITWCVDICNISQAEGPRVVCQAEGSTWVVTINVCCKSSNLLLHCRRGVMKQSVHSLQLQYKDSLTTSPSHVYLEKLMCAAFPEFHQLVSCVVHSTQMQPDPKLQLQRWCDTHYPTVYEFLHWDTESPAPLPTNTNTYEAL
jgi:hypothetical protein